MDEKKVRKKIDKAKLFIIMEHSTVFFSALLASMNIDITTPIKHIAATNGVTIFFKPEAVMALPIPKLVGLILHELLHTVFDHINRCADFGLDKKLFNIAGDHYINLYLVSHGFEIPPGGYCDKKYKGMSTMQIYNDLLKNPPPQGTGDFVMDLLEPPEGMTAKDVEEVVKANIVQAATHAKLAKAAGSIPGEVNIILERILNPVLPWYHILQNYMSSISNDDYTNSRPNKRYMPDFYLPQLRNESMGQMTVGCDVSGSMHKKDLEEINAEVTYIWDTLQPSCMHIMTFDVKVHLNKKFYRGDMLDIMKLKGGGGTIVGPLIDAVRRDQPELCVIFTDGYFTKPNLDDISTDLIWVVKNNPRFTIPLGEVIHMVT